MNICVVGTGYVGLVTGACLAEFGMNIIFIDTDSSKIAMPSSCSRNGTNSGGWIWIDSRN
jgi:UDP-glucose 6-dehydrogenase